MNVSTLTSQTVQPVAWKENNNGIPEKHVNDLIICAINMPSVLYIKPYKIWIPHREGKLSEALGCASVWAWDQCQDQTFKNASMALVYIITEPAHLKDKSILGKHKIDTKLSHASRDDVMDQIISKDWDKTHELISETMAKEQQIKDDLKLNERITYVNPFFDWHSEHLSGINLAVGLALGAVSLRCSELGYYCQYYTAYRQTTTWHNEFGNKFDQDGKWFPYIMQIIGTSPEAIKMSNSKANIKEFDRDTSMIDPNRENTMTAPNRENTSKEVLSDNEHLEAFYPEEYKTKFRKKSPRTIPEYQIDFFMKHYGRYSKNPKKLFGKAYSKRVKNWEKFFDEWLSKNS